LSELMKRFPAANFVYYGDTANVPYGSKSSRQIRRLASEGALSRWLGDVRVSAVDPPSRLEWNADGVRGVIELEASGWGTKVRAQAETPARTGFWERFKAPPEDGKLERELEALLDGLGSSTLKKT